MGTSTDSSYDEQAQTALRGRRGLPHVLPQGNMPNSWTGQRSLPCPVWNDRCPRCWLHLLPSQSLCFAGCPHFDSVAEAAVPLLMTTSKFLPHLQFVTRARLLHNNPCLTILPA